MLAATPAQAFPGAHASAMLGTSLTPGKGPPPPGLPQQHDMKQPRPGQVCVCLPQRASAASSPRRAPGYE